MTQEYGDRLMDISAQGQDIFTDFDVLNEAGKLELVRLPHDRCSTSVLTASHVSMQWQSLCGQGWLCRKFLEKRVMSLKRAHI